jgi:hypothetical protein
MVVDPLQLKRDRPRMGGGRGDPRVRGCLDGATERHGVADRRQTIGTLDQKGRLHRVKAS